MLDHAIRNVHSYFIIFITIALSLFGSTLVQASEADTLLEQLQSSDRSVRRSAARELSERRFRNNQDIVAPLLQLVSSDSDSITREYAAEAVAQNRSSNAISGLVAIMDDQSSRGHEAVVRAVSGLDSAQYAPLLTRALSHSERGVRRQAARGLRDIISQSPDSIEPLLEVIRNDSDTIAREYAAEALAKSSDSRVVPALIDILQNSSRGRGAAAIAIRELKDVRAIPALISALSDSNSSTRRDVIKAMESFTSNTQIVEALIRVARNDSNSLNREYAIENLAKSRNVLAIPVLVEALSHRSSGIRQEAAEALGLIGDKNQLSGLISLLGDDNERVRLAAFDSIKAIMQRLDSNDPIRQLGICLPSITRGQYSDDVKVAALYMDIFLGGFGLYSAGAHGTRRGIEKVDQATIRLIQDALRRLTA